MEKYPGECSLTDGLPRLLASFAAANYVFLLLLLLFIHQPSWETYVYG
jgi:hypothetical protein